MPDILYLAWRYLAFHWRKTAILVASITLVLYLPAGLSILVREGEQHLVARASATPLLVGAKGSPLELVLRSLYFAGEVPEPTTFAAAREIETGGLALPIPLHVRFRAGDDPIVGTSLDYFEFRDLGLSSGQLFGRLGDCVLGAGVARRRQARAGDFVDSSPENVFDLAGVYPLRMRVAGTLAPSGTPDDDAVFVDVKTAWVIAGLAHGHEDLARPEAAPGVLRREGNTITANASVREYNEITDDNIDSFHFHGDLDRFPITAVIAAARNEKSAAILQGRYQSVDRTEQIVRPRETVDQLLATVFTVEAYVLAALVIVGGAALTTMGLVFLLSARLRRREIETLAKIGASRGHVAAILLSEAVLVFLVGGALAVLLSVLTLSFGGQVIRAWVAT